MNCKDVQTHDSDSGTPCLSQQVCQFRRPESQLRRNVDELAFKKALQACSSESQTLK